jgi:hypothetical protein
MSGQPGGRNTDLKCGSARNQLHTLATLGAAMAQAGVVTGMELDIHSGLQFFSTWRNDGSGTRQPQRPRPTMVGPSERYVQPDTRDFFYFTKTGAADARTK